MKRGLQRIILLCLSGAPAAAPAGAFRSYATVVEVQPVVETYYEPVSRTLCADPDPAARELTEPSATIGEDIRRQVRLWQAQRTCRTVTESAARERVTAYRVTYRYRGYTSTTLLSYHPGDRLPVNVSLSPLP
ncbi:MAG: hypothetical protein PVI91_07640 [Gammaproteobacteria bacterium]|jgi:uncharacterized protein YcfJ